MGKFFARLNFFHRIRPSSFVGSSSARQACSRWRDTRSHENHARTHWRAHTRRVFTQLGLERSRGERRQASDASLICQDDASSGRPESPGSLHSPRAPGFLVLKQHTEHFSIRKMFKRPSSIILIWQDYHLHSDKSPL